MSEHDVSERAEARRARRPYAPRMPPAQRREQLIDAALGLIIEQGYPAVTIEAVARVAGVTRPVVYDHFPNLGRLLYALVEREERIALEQLERVAPSDPGDVYPPELLERGVRYFLQAVAERPSTWRIILLPIEGTPSIIRDQVEKNRARMLDRVTGLVEWAYAQAELPVELDLELTAQAILHLSEEAGRSALMDPERYTPERYARFVRSVVGLVWPQDVVSH